MSVGEAAREARIAVNYSLSGEAIDRAVPVVYAGQLTKCGAGVLACELPGVSPGLSGGPGDETPPELAGEDACATLSLAVVVYAGSVGI